eukprot:scaffold41949_cov226-Skeletonema_marinoi.AAC.1
MTLLVASLATGLASLVESGPALCVCRFLSGMGGGTLIIAQAWTAAMFSKNIIGTAMGLVLGIGYTGNGFALAFLGSALLPPLTATSKGESRAWRILLLISGAFGLAAALIALCLADDAPEEKYYRRKEEESESEQPSSLMSEMRSRTSTIRRAAKHYGTWILALQYAIIPFCEQLPGYYIFPSVCSYKRLGWLGLTCFIGGLLSDHANNRMGSLTG